MKKIELQGYARQLLLKAWHKSEKGATSVHPAYYTRQHLLRARPTYRKKVPIYEVCTTTVLKKGKLHHNSKNVKFRSKRAGMI